MHLVRIDELFSVEYGNQFDLNKLNTSGNDVAFVNRSSKKLGITAFVDETSTEPYESGLITVALGGSVLSSFVQPFKFYTGQNVKVLKPLEEMSDLIKEVEG